MNNLKEKLTIWFDLDGTIVDLFSIENYMEYIIKQDAHPFLIAPPLYPLDQFKEIGEQLKKQLNAELNIYSWLAHENPDHTFSKAIQEAKITWLKSNFILDLFTNIKFTPYKQYKTPPPYSGRAILVDDMSENRQSWMANGGFSVIDPTKNLIEKLWGLLEHEKRQ